MGKEMIRSLQEELMLIMLSSTFIFMCLFNTFLHASSYIVVEQDRVQYLPKGSIVMSHDQECNTYINDILKFEDHANSIENDIERAYYYQSISKDISKKIKKLESKYIDFSKKYKSYIYSLENSLDLEHYNFIDSRPSDIPYYEEISVSPSAIEDDVQYKHAIVLKGRYMRLYKYYHNLIQNYNTYIDLLIDLKESKEVLNDPIALKNRLENRLEEIFYSDMPEFLQGVQMFEGDMDSGMKIKRNQSGGILSIEWINDENTPVRVRNFEYLENGLLAKLQDRKENNTVYEAWFGENNFSSDFFDYVFKPGFFPIQYNHVTEVYYDSQFRVKAYKFVTFEGDLIGTIHKEYDDNGRLSNETWTKGKESKIVREFTSLFDSDRGHFKLTERNQEGKIVYQEVIQSSFIDREN